MDICSNCGNALVVDPIPGLARGEWYAMYECPDCGERIFENELGEMIADPTRPIEEGDV